LIFPALFSLYVNDMPSPSHHVELALYAGDTAIIATSRKPTLLVSCLESYLNDLQRWLSKWRIVINVSKSTTIIFACAGRRFIQPRPVTLFREPIEWVDTTRYVGVTLDKGLTWSPHIDQVRKKTAQRMSILGPLLLKFCNNIQKAKTTVSPVYNFTATPTCCDTKPLHISPSKMTHLYENHPVAQRCTQLKTCYSNKTRTAESPRCIMQGLLSPH